MFSVVMDDKSVEDIKFTQYTGKGTYKVYLGDRLIALLFNLPRGWSVVVNGETEFMTSVSGFRTRIDGVIYALRALGIGAYKEESYP